MADDVINVCLQPSGLDFGELPDYIINNLPRNTRIGDILDQHGTMATQGTASDRLSLHNGINEQIMRTTRLNEVAEWNLHDDEGRPVMTIRLIPRFHGRSADEMDDGGGRPPADAPQGLSGYKNKGLTSDKLQQQQQRDKQVSKRSGGQTYPDELPVSRSDSPSPVAHQKKSRIADQSVQLLSPSRPQNALRYRSMSESGETLQLKGILKRRQPILRSLSQCEDGNVDSITTDRCSSPPISSNSRQIRKGSSESQSATNTDDDQISTTACSESENEFGLSTSPRERPQSIKKTARFFNNRVQENLFRPNSSILGQRKKNQRKSQRKRRRTNSGDSQTGESAEEHEEMDAEEIDRDQETDYSGTQPTDRSESMDDKQEQHHQGQQQPRSKSNRKKLQRQQQAASILGNDTKYDGFVIGDGSSNDQKSARKLDPPRHSSGDSGLGDDEGDSFAPVVQQGTKKKNNRNRHRMRTVNCGDSGLDE